jgi:hypothetical protein
LMPGSRARDAIAHAVCGARRRGGRRGESRTVDGLTRICSRRRCDASARGRAPRFSRGGASVTVEELRGPWPGRSPAIGRVLVAWLPSTV